MTSISDTLTAVLVIVLLFGAVCIYLYTRIQQAEQKITLLESILLDLKMSTEFNSYSELPAEEVGNDKPSTANANGVEESHYAPFDEGPHDSEESNQESNKESDAPSTPPAAEEVHDLEPYTSFDGSGNHEDALLSDPIQTETKSLSVQYDSMTLKELQSLAKTRGITGASTMKKGSILEALKTSDKLQAAAGVTGTSSLFLETTSAFPVSEGN
uniref:Rho termination factor-like N-terminal domain-containing protein n=1 Tax=viral metagenome TaxID=1070528 RepID=A0A6C0KQD1_9ZZZZ